MARATELQRNVIWIADLGYSGKIRPVLVISVPPTDHERALFIVMAQIEVVLARILGLTLAGQ